MLKIFTYKFNISYRPCFLGVRAFYVVLLKINYILDSFQIYSKVAKLVQSVLMYPSPGSPLLATYITNEGTSNHIFFSPSSILFLLLDHLAF